MLSSVWLMVLAQIAVCVPGETTFVCKCKAGMVTACVTLVGQNPQRAAQLLKEVVEALDELDALEHASRMTKDDEKKQQELQTAAESLSQSLGHSTLPDCKGQQHHLISRPIARRLGEHPTLKGLYKPRDPRFVARARDKQSHCGYQQWHRDVDKEVIDWLRRSPKATHQQFMDKLREIYSRPDMKARFPHGF
jgi:hypothetical protein